MITSREKLKIERVALEKIISFSGNDIRQVINVLQFWKISSMNDPENLNINSSDVRKKQNQIEKDQQIMMNAYPALMKLMSSKEYRVMTFNQKLQLYFIDFYMMP